MNKGRNIYHNMMKNVTHLVGLGLEHDDDDEAIKKE
jgi:hypothetical protein